MAGIQLQQSLGLDARGHGLLVVRRDHAVLAGQLVPARLVLPGRIADRITEGARQRRLLGHRHHPALVGAQVLAEALMEPVRTQPQVAIAVGCQVRRCLRQVLLGDATGALAGIRREGSDVDQALHVGLATGLADHRAAVGVADQQHRPVDLPDHFPGASCVVGQRGKRQFHRLHAVVAVAMQFQDHLGPMCGPAPESMDKEDGRCRAHVQVSGSGRRDADCAATVRAWR